MGSPDQLLASSTISLGLNRQNIQFGPLFMAHKTASNKRKAPFVCRLNAVQIFLLNFIDAPTKSFLKKYRPHLPPLDSSQQKIKTRDKLNFISINFFIV